MNDFEEFEIQPSLNLGNITSDLRRLSSIITNAVAEGISLGMKKGLASAQAIPLSPMSGAQSAILSQVMKNNALPLSSAMQRRADYLNWWNTKGSKELDSIISQKKKPLSYNRVFGTQVPASVLRAEAKEEALRKKREADLIAHNRDRSQYLRQYYSEAAMNARLKTQTLRHQAELRAEESAKRQAYINSYQPHVQRLKNKYAGLTSEQLQDLKTYHKLSPVWGHDYLRNMGKYASGLTRNITRGMVSPFYSHAIRDPRTSPVIPAAPSPPPRVSSGVLLRNWAEKFSTRMTENAGVIDKDFNSFALLGFGKEARGLQSLFTKASGLDGVMSFATRNPAAAVIGGSLLAAKKVGDAGYSGIKQMIEGLDTPFQALGSATRTLISNFLMFSGILYGLHFIARRLTELTGDTLDKAYTPVTERYKLSGFLEGGLPQAVKTQKKWFGYAKGIYADYGDLSKEAFRIMNASDIVTDPQQAGSLVSLLQMVGGLSGNTNEELSRALVQVRQAMGLGYFQGQDWKAIVQNMPVLQKYIKAHFQRKGINTPLLDLAKNREITTAEFINSLVEAQDDIKNKYATLPLNPERMRSIYRTRELSAFMESGGMLESFASSKYQKSAVNDIEYLAQKSVDIRMMILSGVIDAYKYFDDHREDISNFFGSLGKHAIVGFKTFAPSILSALYAGMTHIASKTSWGLYAGAAKAKFAYGMFDAISKMGLPGEVINKKSALDRLTSTGPLTSVRPFSSPPIYFGKEMKEALLTSGRLYGSNANIMNTIKPATDSVADFLMSASTAQLGRKSDLEDLRTKTTNMVLIISNAGNVLVAKFKNIAGEMIGAFTNAAETVTNIFGDLFSKIGRTTEFISGMGLAGALVLKPQVLGRMIKNNHTLDQMLGNPALYPEFKDSSLGNMYSFAKQAQESGSSYLNIDYASTKALAEKLKNAKPEELNASELRNLADKVYKGVVKLKESPSKIAVENPNLDAIASNTGQIVDALSGIASLISDAQRELGLRQVGNYGYATDVGGRSPHPATTTSAVVQNIYKSFTTTPSYIHMEGYI